MIVYLEILRDSETTPIRINRICKITGYLLNIQKKKSIACLYAGSKQLENGIKKTTQFTGASTRAKHLRQQKGKL